MNTWNSGYVTEIGYPHANQSELSPQMLNLALMNRNIAASTGRPLRYLELGYGQGLTLNINAAACPGEYWGTDFNPSHAANARELAEMSGADTHFFDLSFAELANREDLPEFDVITLHGIWSWISAENRSVIIDIVRRKLAVGGILYIGYNCMPGWAPAIPLRHLLNLHADLAGAESSGISDRISAAIGFAQQVVGSGAKYFEVNPGEAARLENLDRGKRDYLAHEYFNRDWHPMAFSEVSQLLSQAKVDFAASATFLEHVDIFCFRPEAQQLMSEISHPVLRESVRDFLVNQTFRKDIYVKGIRRMTPMDRNEKLLSMGFTLIKSPHDFPMKWTGQTGEVALQEALFRPLLEALAENGFAPKSVSELVAHRALQGHSLDSLLQALVILTGTRYTRPTQHADAIKMSQPRCSALNLHLCKKARSSSDVTALASPVLGGGVSVGQLEQLMLLAAKEGMTTPEAWAVYVWDIFDAQGLTLMKEGRGLITREENLAELEARAIDFASKQLPILQALGVARL